jgi:hypothetical protein
MNDPTGTFDYGAAMGMGLTGLVTGLLPLLVGMFRGSGILGRAGFLASFLGGAFGGPFLAVGVAVLATVAIVVLTNKRATATATTPAWPETGSGPGAVGLTPGTSPGTDIVVAPRAPAPTLPGLSSGGPTVRCGCGREYGGDGTALPPWCKHCGADMKRAPANPVPASPIESGPAPLDSPTTDVVVQPRPAAPTVPSPRSGGVTVRCGCGREYGGDATPLPPWCKHCGADLKRPPAPPAPAVSVPAEDVAAPGA